MPRVATAKPTAKIRRETATFTLAVSNFQGAVNPQVDHFLSKGQLPNSHLLLIACPLSDKSFDAIMADSAVTVRTRKFITNRLLSRKQFVV